MKKLSLLILFLKLNDIKIQFYLIHPFWSHMHVSLFEFRRSDPHVPTFFPFYFLHSFKHILFAENLPGETSVRCEVEKLKQDQIKGFDIFLLLVK